MTKYQKQLLVSLPGAILCFLAMYLTFPLMWVGAVCIIPFAFFLCWTIGLIVSMVYYSGFGKWLSEDDK